MKLHKSLLLFGVGAILLTACGDDRGNEEDTTKKEPETEEVEEVDEDVTGLEENLEDTEVGNVEKSEFGTMTKLVEPFDINQTLENGPFVVNVQKAQMTELEPADDYIELFDNEKITIITLLIDVTNNSDDTNTIYPDQGSIVTNTGKQVEAEIWFSDNVGGDFFGQVTKEGEVWFMFEDDPEKIDNIRYIISSGHDKDWDSFGEDLEFSIDF